MRISEDEVLAQVRDLIESVERSSSPEEISDLEKLTEGEHDYKIKLDEYRVGLMIHRNVVTFVRCLHRYKVKLDEYRVGLMIHRNVVTFVRCLHRNDITNFFLAQIR